MMNAHERTRLVETLIEHGTTIECSGEIGQDDSPETDAETRQPWRWFVQRDCIGVTLVAAKPVLRQLITSICSTAGITPPQSLDEVEGVIDEASEMLAEHLCTEMFVSAIMGQEDLCADESPSGTAH